MNNKKDNDMIKVYAGLESHNSALRGIKISKLPKINKERFPIRRTKINLNEVKDSNEI